MTKRLLLKAAALVACLLCTMGAAAAEEAYACYTSSNTTLTFYYDSQRATRPGDTYSISYSQPAPSVPYLYASWHDCGYYATRVVFDSSFANYRPTETYYWFI